MAYIGWIMVAMLAIGMGLRMLVDREWTWSVHQSNVEQRGRKKADRNADWDTHVKRSAFLILLLGLVCLAMPFLMV
jgi:hypothetical protein